MMIYYYTIKGRVYQCVKSDKPLSSEEFMYTCGELPPRYPVPARGVSHEPL
jgi:hypothetical protein